MTHDQLGVSIIEFRFTFVALVCMMAAGCSTKPSKPLPKTYSVTGKVVDNAGSTMAGSLEFRPDENGEMRALGQVMEDGTFSLYTLLVDGDKLDGAVEGNYSATFFPFGKDHSIKPIALNENYTVEPKENRFEIKLPKGS